MDLPQILLPYEGGYRKAPWSVIAALCAAFLVEIAWQWFSPQVILGHRLLNSPEGTWIIQETHSNAIRFATTAAFLCAYVFVVPKLALIMCFAMFAAVLCFAEFSHALSGDLSFWIGSVIPLVFLFAALVLSMRIWLRHRAAHGF